MMDTQNISLLAAPRPTLLPRWGIRAGLLLCVLAAVSMSGCAVNRATASVSPEVDLAHLKTFYVVKFSPDGRGVNAVIASGLGKLGREATTGPESLTPTTGVDAIVTYQDKWQWDLTMYMIELTVSIREPGTNRLLASGNSYHTSLARKTPEEMVAEVLSSMFDAGKKGAESRK
jgi:hypothetical protein